MDSVRYANLLKRRIAGCALVVVVLEEGHDFTFLNSVMQLASDVGAKCVMVPYTRMQELRGGLEYVGLYFA